MSGPDIPEACPHCDAAPPASQLDTHVVREHADLPPCTARIEPEGGGLYTCSFRAAHDGGEYGTWHASKRDEHMGRYIWNDTATGATPHRPPEPRVRSLNELKAMGVLSHTVVAAGADTPERPFRATCAALHTDAQGNVIPCPDEQPDRHPALTAKLYAPTSETDRLRQAEIRAAVAEHEAEAYRNQVQALIRSMQRERGLPEGELSDGDVVVVHRERPLSEQRVREIIRDELDRAARAARRER